MFASIETTNIIDEIRKRYDMEDYGRAIGLATLVQLYKFLKRNEVAVKALYVIGPEGEPLLYDSTRD